MIAHSFRGEVFGPAQRLHGATFAVSAAFIAATLDPNGIVVDIGRAAEVLHRILAPLNYRNLDELEAFKTVNTTTEFLTRHVFDGLAAAVKSGELGRAGREIGAIRVTIAESPTARAWYEGALWQQ
jgi:6-pyruvoyl-tetrahydropterin synthase